MPEVRVQISSEPTATAQIVSSGLRALNRSFLGEYATEPIAVDVFAEDGEILGGALGSLHLGWLFIGILWIPESLRFAGIGTRVLEVLESEAIRRGSRSSDPGHDELSGGAVLRESWIRRMWTSRELRFRLRPHLHDQGLPANGQTCPTRHRSLKFESRLD